MALTEKEQALYDAIKKGMDSPGEGWLHEIADESHSTAGVLGSLIKKGLVTSDLVQDQGIQDCYWVEICDKGDQDGQ